MRYILTHSLLFLTLCFSIASNAVSLFNIEGRILDEAEGPLAGVNITVDKRVVTTDEEGKFTLAMPFKETYQLYFSKKGYFSSIQTFSHFELASNSQSVNLSNITLVKEQLGRVRLAFGGDVMMGRRFYKPYFGDAVLIHEDNKLSDSKAIVAHIKPYMSLADFAAVNLETQIADKLPGERAPKSVTFYSQPETLDALSWAGIDYVSLGNNHTYDYMDSGLRSTLDFLQKSELGFSGAGINETQALLAHHQRINDTEFSMLGYVGWEGGSNPTQTANQDHGGAAYGSTENMLASVTKEAEQHRVTIVQYHGSQEYADNPTVVTEQRLKSSLDAGADLAIAHHPHVTQGLELYNGKLIAYSMGNFIFDQNFAATQHSFILYVWLDGEKFHRAEIVPLYVKGYIPTPATGMHRSTVMKRLSMLSKARNTHISQSGGHGIIDSNNKLEPTKQDYEINFANEEKVASLYHLPWHVQIDKVVVPNEHINYRLGTNLFNGSDFESFDYFDSPERGWLFDRNITKINNYGASGVHSLGLSLEQNQTSLFGMKSFRRVFGASQPMTIKARFKTDKLVKATFYWQGRKTDQKLFDAFDNSEKHLINSVALMPRKLPEQSWQNVEVEFNSPRIGYKSYRVLVEFEQQESGKGQLDIDDFSLVEWQTAFSQSQIPLLLNTSSQQATFIGINKATELPVVIRY